MLKQLLLGLIVLNVLALPAKNRSTNTNKEDFNIQVKNKNAKNLKLDRFDDFVDFPGGLTGGFGGSATFPHDPGSVEMIGKPFTVTIQGTSISYYSEDGFVANLNNISRKIHEYTINVTNKVGVHEFYQRGVCIKRIFTYIYKDTVYTSEESKEDAWRNAVISDAENGIITKAEAEDEYVQFLLASSPNSNKRGIETVPSSVLLPYYAHQPSSQTGTIYSRVEWQDSTGAWMPLGNCYASLYINDEKYATSQLNEDGAIMFTIGSDSKFWGKTCSVQLRVYTESDTFTLGSDYSSFIDGSPLGVFDEKFAICSKYYDKYIDGSLDFYIPASRAYGCYEKTSNALSVCSALAICERFAKQNVRGYAGNVNHNLYHLNVELSYSNCLFNFGSSSSLYCPAGEEWILPFRLYGLYVQGILRLLGSTVVIPFFDEGGNFMYDTESAFSKEARAQIVWRRSLANMFAILAYMSMEEKIGQLGVTQSIRDLIDDLSNYVPDEYSGEGSIRCVTTYLYSLYFGYTGRNGRTISCPNEHYCDYFDFVFHGALNTLKEFVSYYFPANISTQGGNNSILEDLNIAPSKIKLVNVVDDNTYPIMEWKAGGSASHPNDVFDLWFYSDYSHNFKIQGITKNQYTINNGIVRYTLTSSQKNQLMALFDCWDGKCSVAVAGRRNDGNYNTGPYWSMFTTIANPTIIYDDVVTEKFLLFNTSYVNETFYYGHELFIKFIKTGNAFFLTRGDEADTIITLRDAYGNVLAESDDGAYDKNAFLSYNVVEGELYRVDVNTKIYAPDNISYVSGAQFDIIQSINSYDYFGNITHPTSLNGIRRVNCYGYDDYSSQFRFEENSAAALLFEPSVYGGYHVEFQHTSPINVSMIFLDNTHDWDNFYYSGESYHKIGYSANDYFIVKPNEPVLILVSRENRNAPLGEGSLEKQFNFTLGLSFGVIN